MKFEIVRYITNIESIAVGRGIRILPYLRKTYGPEHISIAREWNNLGMSWERLRKLEKAIVYYKKALKIFRDSMGKDHPTTKSVRENLESAQKKLK